ncbi:MAG: D-alanyl-D-alanine carboxypeptidase [Clostridia bacterium]|nr:D-alanyl-D-alanine carboxypeptidase [Clostridia bacterium]
MNEKKKLNILFLLSLICIIAAVVCNSLSAEHRETVAAFGTENTDRLSSRSVLMLESEGGRICYSKNPHQQMPIASLTKIMTAYVALEKTVELDREFTFTEDIIEAMKRANASVAGFKPGERVSLRDMLYGVMLPSGGDAALGVAMHISGGEKEFVALMNHYADLLGMKSTRFSDATGLDDVNNYSTASDMALLFSKALKNDMFLEIITTDSYLTAATEQHKNGILLKSTLTEPMKEYSLDTKILGGKTGYTTGAGLCLASYAEVDGHRYVLITLGAGDGEKYPSYHFEDAAVLYDKYYMT